MAALSILKTKDQCDDHAVADHPDDFLLWFVLQFCLCDKTLVLGTDAGHQHRRYSSDFLVHRFFLMVQLGDRFFLEP